MAKARNSGRKKSGHRRLKKAHEVMPDGAHAYTWPYQAMLACRAAEARDRERRAEAAEAAAQAAKTARTEQEAKNAAAEAQRQASLAPRPCLRCGEILPPDAFEPHGRAYNGRMGCCRPCAQLIRDRKAAPVGRRPPTFLNPAPPRPCRACGLLFSPAERRRVYCSAACRKRRQTETANAHRRENRAAHPAAAKQRQSEWRERNPDKCRQYRRRYNQANRSRMSAAHAAWAARNRARVSAYMREFRLRRAAVEIAKREFAEAGVFLLVRARSGFWRGHAPGAAIGASETILARYEQAGKAWTVLPPAIAGEAIRRRVVRWARSEQAAGAK